MNTPAYNIIFSFFAMFAPALGAEEFKLEKIGHVMGILVSGTIGGKSDKAVVITTQTGRVFIANQAVVSEDSSRLTLVGSPKLVHNGEVHSGKDADATLIIKEKEQVFIRGEWQSVLQMKKFKEPFDKKWNQQNRDQQKRHK